MDNVSYPVGHFEWVFTQGSEGAPTEFRLKWGATPGGPYPNQAVLASADRSALYTATLPGPGTYYARLWAYNPTAGEYAQSNEVQFVAGAETVTIRKGVTIG